LLPYLEPPALRVGPATIQVFGLFAALGVLVAVRVAARAAAAEGLDGRVPKDFAIWGVVSGILSGHLVHLLAYHPEELADPWRILRVWEGLSSYGGLLGGVIAALAWFPLRRVRLSDYADSLALGMAPGWAIARLGCFAIHDHPGTLTDFPLAVRFPGGARHDLGLYEALALGAIAGVLWLLRRRGAMRGRLLAVLGLLYAPSRFLLDFLRARDLPYVDARYLGLTPAQYASVAVAGWALWRLSRPPGARPAGGAP
jgi:phosphatidylglycerol:prolipoprotein diacylglycerol transferase